MSKQMSLVDINYSKNIHGLVKFELNAIIYKISKRKKKFIKECSIKKTLVLIYAYFLIIALNLTKCILA